MDSTDSNSNNEGATPSVISDPMKEALIAFERAIEMAKLDRDKMLARSQDTPIPRFRILLGEIAFFSGKALEGVNKTPCLQEQMARVFLKDFEIGSESVNYFALISEVFCHFCKQLLSSEKVSKSVLQLLSFSLLIFKNFTDCSPQFVQNAARNDNLMETIAGVIDQLHRGTSNEECVQLLKTSTEVMYNIYRQNNSCQKPLLKNIRDGKKTEGNVEPMKSEILCKGDAMKGLQLNRQKETPPAAGWRDEVAWRIVTQTKRMTLFHIPVEARASLLVEQLRAKTHLTDAEVELIYAEQANAGRMRVIIERLALRMTTEVFNDFLDAIGDACVCNLPALKQELRRCYDEQQATDAMQRLSF